MAKQYLLFDLDGTITNSQSGIINCVKYALEYLKCDIPSEAVLKRFIGPPLMFAFMNYCGMDEATAQKALEKYRERYSKVGLFENEVYNGIEELLKKLKEQNRTIILATAKPQEYSERIIEHFNLSRYFDRIVGATFDGRISYKTEVIKEVLRLYKITDKATAVMIGDRDQDILGAKDNGIQSIGVEYGFAESGELIKAGADYIAKTPAEIINYI